MTLQTVPLDTPEGVSARLGWDPATSVHDRRRIIAKELIAAKLNCDVKDIRIEREAPRGFGYHTRLIASRGGEELPISIVTASYRAATVVAICDPSLSVGIDIRDMHPDDADIRQMRRHSRLIDESNTEELLPVISFNAKTSTDEQKKHDDFVDRMMEKGYTRKQVRLLCEWYLRVRKSS